MKRRLFLELLEDRQLLAAEIMVDLAVTPASVDEDGATSLVYRFTRTGDTDNPLTVGFGVSGTATFSIDYTQQGAASFSADQGTVAFAAGEAAAEVLIDPSGDTEVEPDETVILTLQPGDGYAVAPQVDDFEDGTRQGWRVGIPLFNPVNVETGGPNGAGDHYLEAISNGSNSAGGRLIIFNTAQRLEDYRNVRSVSMDLNNLGDTPLTMRLTIGKEFGGGPAVSTQAVVLPPGSGWQRASFSLDPADLTPLAGAVIDDVLANPAVLRLLHNEVPNFVGSPIVARLGVDNIEAVGGKPGSVTGTIVDDEQEVSLRVAPSAVREDGLQNLLFQFTRTGPLTGSLTVPFTVAGSASFNADYQASGAASFSDSAGSVVFAAGASTATVTISPGADQEVEEDETVSLTLRDGEGYTVGTVQPVVGTITDDDQLVTLSVSPTSVREDGVASLTFRFTRVGAINSALNVAFDVGGTASHLADYLASGAFEFSSEAGSVDFGPGAATASVTIIPRTDRFVEADETVQLRILPGSEYLVGTEDAVTGTIENDDQSVRLSVAPAAVREDGADSLVFMVARNGAIGEPLTVSLDVAGTAQFDDDYTQVGANSFSGAAGTVEFEANQSTATITIDPRADGLVEPSETVALTLRSSADYVVAGSGEATASILNDDQEVRLSVAPGEVFEDAGTAAVFTFTRSGAITDPLSVSFLVGGSAASGDDYTVAGADSFSEGEGRASFAAGVATATVTITPVADARAETDETVALTLQAGSGYTVATVETVVGTIVNDDQEVFLSIAPAAVREDGDTSLEYSFTRTGRIGDSLTVPFSVTGDATPDVDFTQQGADTLTATAGSVTFTPGAATVTVRLDPVADAIVEADEFIEFTLVQGDDYTVGTADAVRGTITEDDQVVTLAVEPAAVVEDGAAHLAFTFQRSGATQSPLTVNFSVGGSAIPGGDFLVSGAATFDETAGSVAFAAGVEQLVVMIDPVADDDVETDETIELTLQPGNDYAVGTSNPVVGIIREDDQSMTLETTTGSVSEDGAQHLVFTFRRQGAVEAALTVDFDVAGSAQFEADYAVFGASSFAATGGSVAFAAGATAAIVRVAPSADADLESDETVQLSLRASDQYQLQLPVTATGTITNDDQSVTLSIAPGEVVEDGAENLVFTLDRSGFVAGELVAEFTIGGTAAAETDYVLHGAESFVDGVGTVRFSAEQTSVNLTIAPRQDVDLEPDETVVVTLRPAAGYTPGVPATAVGRIVNDDQLVTISAAPRESEEDAGTPLLFTISRAGATTAPLTVSFLVEGSAELESDYTQSGAATFQADVGTVFFAAGETSVTVAIQPLADELAELDEEITLTLQPGGAYTVGIEDSATATIRNDDLGSGLVLTTTRTQQANVLRIERATPLGVVHFVHGTQAGETYLPQLDITVDMADPVVFALGFADPTGSAVAHLPAGLFESSDTVYLQAYERAPVPRTSNLMRAAAGAPASARFSGEALSAVSCAPPCLPEDPDDVDRDGVVAPRDALQIINFLNQAGSLALNAPSPLDTTGDGWVTPQDALRVINKLNSAAVEGEAARDALFAAWDRVWTEESRRQQRERVASGASRSET